MCCCLTRNRQTIVFIFTRSFIFYAHCRLWILPSILILCILRFAILTYFYKKFITTLIRCFCLNQLADTWLLIWVSFRIHETTKSYQNISIVSFLSCSGVIVYSFILGIYKCQLCSFRKISFINCKFNRLLHIHYSTTHINIALPAIFCVFSHITIISVG